MLSVSRRAVYHFRWRECIFGYGGYSQRRQWRRAHRICRGGHRIHNITQIPRAARSAVPAPADSSATTRSWSRCMEVALEYSHPGNDEAEFQLHVSGRRKPGVAVCRSRGAILRATATPREQDGETKQISTALGLSEGFLLTARPISYIMLTIKSGRVSPLFVSC